MSRKINPRVYQFFFLFFPLLFLAWSSISQPLSIRYSAVGPSCAGATDGFITVYGSGGLRPYTYSYNGGSYSSNNLFAGLGAISNISVSVKDAAGSIFSESNITLSTPANSLIIRPDSLFCTGSTLPLGRPRRTIQVSQTLMPNTPPLPLLKTLFIPWSARFLETET
jgi:hypothetical protein